jgi:putative ABC transport system ATP-binding protein
MLRAVSIRETQMISVDYANPAPRSPALAPMIELRNVEKSYPAGHGRTWVLRQISLEVREGEFVTIMGPSGAGKSTLLGIVGLYDGDWSGQYFVDGCSVHGLKPRQRIELNKRYVGFVFQKYHLLDDLTVYENLDIPLSYRDIPRKERQAIVADVLDRFGIVAKKDLYPAQLSGGQQQLVGVARAVISRPKLLLADEPTGNLHSGQAQQIMELFQQLNRHGTTIVQVTHSEANAAFGSRVIELRDGWMTEDRQLAR